ncbi:MAG: hypothetical protein HN605_05190 [Thaumarchaeota archaeon]|jgi:hypothetical protein|nr:hypothetical protein [Nitrososphaerota archaeon]
MAETGSLMGMVGAFIAVAIMLGIGTIILGGAATDCSTVTGYDSTTPASSTGWAQQCLQNESQSQAGYSLLMITLIVVAAVVVLTVVRMLG